MKKELPIEGTLRISNNLFFKEVKEFLTSGKDVLFTVNGNSMRPFLSHGDKVLLSPATNKDLTFGKIILAKSKFGFVLHRLVWKNSKAIWLAGDNNLVQLEKIEIEDILGFVKFAEIEGKKVNVLSFTHLFLSGLWFFLRPLRLGIYKIKRFF